MAHRPRGRKPGWQQRKSVGHGPRLFEGEVPEGRPPGGGVFQNFSWRIALGIIALGVLAALVAHYAC